jgi:hypothetical protein
MMISDWSVMASAIWSARVLIWMADVRVRELVARVGE